MNIPRRRWVPVLLYVTVTVAAACGSKDPAGPLGPGPDTFFNWLPALLRDQQAAQPAHELMSFLVVRSNYTNRPALVATLERLGEAPQVYRSTAPGYSPADEPILAAIYAHVQQARAFLAGDIGLGFLQLPTLETDRG